MGSLAEFDLRHLCGFGMFACRKWRRRRGTCTCTCVGFRGRGGANFGDKRKEVKMGEFMLGMGVV